MTATLDVLAWVLAGAFFLIGVRAGFDGTQLEGRLSGTDRLLIAVHDAARAGFWLALAGLFVGFALVDDPYAFRWFGMIPISMAALRMLAAVGLSRGR
ncbi:MAG TPA: hypothetical protein VF058_06215 [Actinomycetota bacterium]